MAALDMTVVGAPAAQARQAARARASWRSTACSTRWTAPSVLRQARRPARRRARDRLVVRRGLRRCCSTWWRRSIRACRSISSRPASTFAETLDYVETLKRHLGLRNVRALRPDPKDLARFDPRGDLWETDPDSCCHIRKTEPLDAEIAQFGGWVTGRKRYQTAERGVLPHFELTSRRPHQGQSAGLFLRTPTSTPTRSSTACPSIRCSLRATARSAARRARRSSPKARTRAPAAGAGSTRKSAASTSTSTERSPSRWRTSSATSGRTAPSSPIRSAPGPRATTPRRVRYTHIPLPVFLANREAVLSQPASGRAAGLAGREGRGRGGRSWRASPRSRISFPGFTDGRGYSTRAAAQPSATATPANCARWATCSHDQIPLMRRCGITAFVVKHEPTRKALENGSLATVDLYYQPIGGVPVPDGTRPFLRRGERDRDRITALPIHRCHPCESRDPSSHGFGLTNGSLPSQG